MARGESGAADNLESLRKCGITACGGRVVAIGLNVADLSAFAEFPGDSDCCLDF
jgi:hypothetical protein